MAKVRINQSGSIKMISRSAKDGMRGFMEEVLDVAVANAPRETGELQESGKLWENPKSFRIAFDAPHAAVQHERLDFNHPNGGKAKYLEDAFNDYLPGAVVRVANSIKKDLK